MDKPDTKPVDGTSEPDQEPTGGGFGRKMIVGILVFWVLVVVVLILFRYPFIFSQLVGGGEDRSLLAVVSAELNANELNIEFMCSKPDQPAGVFVVSGHLPSNSSSSDTEQENRIAGTDIIFNGASYEILFEAADPGLLPGRQGGLTINWTNNERGTIQLDLGGSFALEEVSSNRAFLIISRSDTDFRAANIIHN